jgi:predicted secreted protein
MGVTSALVLYAVIWWMTFLVVLPFKVKTQGDLGDVIPGTHAGAPEHHHLKRKAWITTGIAAVLWAIIAPIIIMGWLPVSEMAIFQRALDPL